PLPPDFTSLYRLFLRTSAASVLHQPRATRYLRKLWRPTFEDAARATSQLQNQSHNRNELERWLESWHLRIDNTLALLFTSSKTKGIPHQVTRNLALLFRSEQARLDTQRFPQWKPQLPLDSSEYKPGTPELPERRRREEAGALDALQDVVRMAEGRAQLTFGKIRVGRRFRN
ncbi:hypothetical protein FB45DRAFT_206925, partial [Roridomyces roridus]